MWDRRKVRSVGGFDNEIAEGSYRLATPTGGDYYQFGQEGRDLAEKGLSEAESGQGIAQQKLRQGLGAAAMQQAALARGGGPMAQRAAMMAGAQQASQGVGQAAMLQQQELAAARAAAQGAIQQQAALGMNLEQARYQADRDQMMGHLQQQQINQREEEADRQFGMGLFATLTGGLGALGSKLANAKSDSKLKGAYSPGDAKKGPSGAGPRSAPVSDVDADVWLGEPRDDSAIERGIAIRDAVSAPLESMPESRSPRLDRYYAPVVRADKGNSDLIRYAPIDDGTVEAQRRMEYARVPMEGERIPSASESESAGAIPLSERLRGRRQAIEGYLSGSGSREVPAPGGVRGLWDPPSPRAQQRVIDEIEPRPVAKAATATKGSDASIKATEKATQERGAKTAAIKKKAAGPLPEPRMSQPLDGALSQKGNPYDVSESVRKGIEGASAVVDAVKSDSNAKRGLAADKTMDDLDAYHYEYRPEFQRRLGLPEGHRVGVMADDLERTPLGAAAVKETEDGKVIDRDNYLFGVVTPGLQRLHERLEALEKKKGKK